MKLLFGNPRRGQKFIERDGRLALFLPQALRNLRLRVGQHAAADRDCNKVRASFADGRVRPATREQARGNGENKRRHSDLHDIIQSGSKCVFGTRVMLWQPNALATSLNPISLSPSSETIESFPAPLA